MDSPALTVILTVVLNFLIWWFQRVINRKTILIERRKLESETSREEISAITSVTEKYNDLSEKYISTASELTELKIRIDTRCADIDALKEQVALVSDENTILKEKNEKIQRDVEVLKIENEKLRLESADLRKGIAILVKQLREEGISPAWKPTD